MGGLALLTGVGGDLMLDSSADSLEESRSPLGCVAVIHSPAEIAAAWPTKVTSSRQRGLTAYAE